MRLKLCIITVLAAMSFVGCGSEITIQESVAQPPPSTIRTVGTLSGFGYATGGESYQAFHSLGNPIPVPIQRSENGVYDMK